MNVPYRPIRILAIAIASATASIGVYCAVMQSYYVRGGKWQRRESEFIMRPCHIFRVCRHRCASTGTVRASAKIRSRFHAHNTAGCNREKKTDYPRVFEHLRPYSRRACMRRIRGMHTRRGAYMSIGRIQVREGFIV